MTRYIVELRTVYGRQIYCVIDTQRGNRTVARCDTHADAANVNTAMNAHHALALEAQ